MKILKVHCFQHVPFEGLGCIEEWCKKNNYEISYTQFFKEYKIPDLDSYDLLIVMGGPMGIFDIKEYPWLKEEKSAIKKAIEAGKKITGICLGAQLIADVLNARVYPNSEKEIGWFPIKTTEAGKRHKLLQGIDSEFTVFHWHGDTFELPLGATLLFSSTACNNQAFILNNQVLAFQFHFEITAPGIKKLVDNCRSELIDAKYIQSENKILEEKSHIAKNNKWIENILTNFVIL